MKGLRIFAAECGGWKGIGAEDLHISTLKAASSWRQKINVLTKIHAYTVLYAFQVAQVVFAFAYSSHIQESRRHDKDTHYEAKWTGKEQSYLFLDEASIIIVADSIRGIVIPTLLLFASLLLYPFLD